MSVPPFVPPEDATTSRWWDATRSERLLLQRCADCGSVQHPPRPLCVECGGASLEEAEASGQGVVDTFTVVRRSPMPGFEPPYVVARVILAEGPIVLTNIVDCEPEHVRCDLPVGLRWQALGDGRSLPVFSPRSNDA